MNRFAKSFVVTASALAAICNTGDATGAEHFPDAATTGVPAGWVPTRVERGDVRITQAGAVVEDLRIIDGDLLIDAENVTVRRVELLGGFIRNDPAKVCRNGLILENVSILPGDRTTSSMDPPAIGSGGYVARSVKIDGLSEGFRVGGRDAGCGDVVIEKSYARIAAPTVCTDWHGDGIQGYDGAKLTVRDTSLELVETRSCSGTAPFFYPADQGNAAVEIDGLLVKGGGFSFRLGTPGTVRRLFVVKGSWGYASSDVNCALVTSWRAAVVAEKVGRPSFPGQPIACGGGTVSTRREGG